MLKSYQRRAFLLMAFIALEPAIGSAARAADTHATTHTATESLWDILTISPRLAAETGPPNGANARTLPDSVRAARSTRRPLGPVPGFTLPANRSGESEADTLFGKRKKHSGIFGSVGDWFDQMQRSTGTKIKVTGHNTLSFRWEKVSGNNASYSDEQYYGRGSNGVYADTDLTVDATLFNSLHYQTRISNSLFNNPNDNRVKLDYNTKKMRFEWGDINAGFQGNSLIDFNRYLSGFQVTNQWTRQFRTQLLYSQTKAETRTITLPGNGSAGPYYVYAGQIVEGSDQVRVNDRVMNKGTEYTLDTYTGELRFLQGNVVLPSSTIAVTFESLGFNQSQGNIYGVRTEYNPHGGTHFGLTYVTQQSRGSNGLQTRTQQFFGFETPGAAYVLDAPIDLTKPLIVTVGGVPLVRGTDYVVDASLTNQIRILRGVPQTVIVQVQYVPLNTNPAPGNRSVLGLDGRFALGGLGSVTLETALSGLNLLDNNIGGHAWQIRADLNPFRTLHSTLTLRNVNPTFSSIQSPGFNRNEHSIEFSNEYAPSKNLRFTMNWQKAKRPSYSGATGLSQFTITPTGNDNYNQYALGASYSFARNGTLTLSRSNLSTDYAQGGNSSYLTDSLNLNYGIGSWSLEGSLSKSRNASSSIFNLLGLTGASQGTQATSYTSSAFTKRFGLRWQASRWLTLSGNISDNDITDQSGTSGNHSNARDTQLSANFSLIRNLRLNYTYELSDTGNASNFLNQLTGGSTSSTTTATGSSSGSSSGSGSILGTAIRSVWPSLLARTRDIVAGGSQSAASSSLGSSFPTLTGGGGFNANLGGYGNYSGYYGSSTGNGYGVSSFGGKSRSNRLTLDYQPRPNFQIGLQYDSAASVGDYQYNSNRNNMGFNFGWQPNDKLQLNATYSLQRIAYNAGLGNTLSNTLLLSIQGHPFGGKLGTQLSWQALRTNSSLNFAAVSGTGTTTATNTTPTDTSTNLNSLALRLEYPIFRNQTLFVEMLNSDASGYLGSTDSDLRIGIDFALNRALKFSLGWQTLSRLNKDPQYSTYNYKVNSLLAELGLRF